MRSVSAEEVRQGVIRELRVGNAAFTSIEILSALLRRTASFLCPCSDSVIVRTVLRSIEGLGPVDADLKKLAETTLDEITAYGDVVECRDLAVSEIGRAAVLLYLAPPSFVSREKGGAVILGIAPDQISPLPEDLLRHVEHVNHVRRIPSGVLENLRQDLLGFGLVELPFERWAKAPAPCSADDHISRFDQALERAPPSGEIAELQLLDPSTPVGFYPDRWVDPRQHSGRFIARRRQAYGAKLWSYVALVNGKSKQFVDLPLPGSRSRGCDEAWLLQLALDARHGKPQEFRRQREGDRSIVEFFSPIPMWAQRRWDAVAMRLKNRGSLFAYRFPEGEIEEEIRFLKERLWMHERKGS